MRCSARKENEMTLAEAITKFSIEVLQLDETKKDPAMVAAIAELVSSIPINLQDL